jgi:hypothetical protein
MKIIVVFLALTAVSLGLAVSGFAQQAAAVTDTYQIGNKQIVIPSPDGFLEAASQIPLIKQHFTATESSGNDFLAVHIPAEHLQRLKKGEVFDLTFYTKVSVSKSLKALDATEADFAQFVATFKKSFPALSDPNGKEMKATLKSISENLSNLNKTETTYTLSQPVNVGLIEDNRNAYGALLLTQMKLTTGGNEMVKTLLGGISVVRVRGKIIFIYTYKAFEKEQNIAELQQFSKQWLARIIAANSGAK